MLIIYKRIPNFYVFFYMLLDIFLLSLSHHSLYNLKVSNIYMNIISGLAVASIKMHENKPAIAFLCNLDLF